ncbi:MAG: hypothetical protein EOS46_20050 [Mesorhizobium sp.]|nr:MULTISPECIES: hypothetical protein [unclassified Mesorhizobium]RUW50733.1 hypothetical protein EOA36_16025 [Mesorhizobium sp. M8A.F.Ca.ET.021.01.1.1]TGS79556.1 hypothetical protein EN824_20515 [Mesorhizobium sp. M8A.F.Ca.ET.181.01.1.1]RWF45783.1 MAG: hypothetical protein EOS46_20050 [Mesorhizobium sp.]TGS41876.1 hypothetical protein EN825_23105 [Mesorhizobium sp. M8A.F.Ca.ET.182.01.1.1]TIT65686.1 MAG: hypothetical protein E5W90_15430 [Mesorhizobium sp.]
MTVNSRICPRGNKSSPRQVFSTYATSGVEEIGMPHHCQASDHGCGVGRRRALASMMVVRLSLVALDTGDADEFTFSTAGDFVRFRRLSSRKQGKIAVAS